MKRNFVPKVPHPILCKLIKKRAGEISRVVFLQ